MNLLRSSTTVEIPVTMDTLEVVSSNTQKVLPTVARLCLIATFLEDGLRMWFQWDDQRDYMDKVWGCGKILGTLFVITNLVGQLGGCAMVLLRKKVDIGCGVLLFTIILQGVAYKLIWDIYFIIRHCGLVGGLQLLIAEAHGDGKTLFAGVPSLGENKPKTYLQLSGRLLLVIMFITVLRFDSSTIFILQDLLGGSMMLLVAVGYRTKQCALMLVLLLAILNVIHNHFWSVPDGENDTALRDLLKYDFFQVLSIIGGLLMIVYLGPGDVSFDERKKKW